MNPRTHGARRTTATVVLQIAVIAAALLTGRALTIPPVGSVTTTPAATPEPGLPNDLAVMCVSADTDGQWDRCGWRTGPDTWKIAEYPDLGAPRWSCLTTTGAPCRPRPALASR